MNCLTGVSRIVGAVGVARRRACALGEDVDQRRGIVLKAIGRITVVVGLIDAAQAVFPAEACAVAAHGLFQNESSQSPCAGGVVAARRHHIKMNPAIGDVSEVAKRHLGKRPDEVADDLLAKAEHLIAAK